MRETQRVVPVEAASFDMLVKGIEQIARSHEVVTVAIGYGPDRRHSSGSEKWHAVVVHVERPEF